MGNVQGKAAWRKRFKELRAAISADERQRMDVGIAENVVALPEYRQAEAVLAYLAFGAEVETRGIIGRAWADGKVVLLPRCVPGTRQMAWYRVDSFDGLVRSSFGVKEPAEDPAREVDPATLRRALVLVPGLTFDPQGFRLGYGGGFYDVFLSGVDTARIVPVGLCRECQMSECVEVRDAHDLPAQAVVTEARVIRPDRA